MSKHMDNLASLLDYAKSHGFPEACLNCWVNNREDPIIDINQTAIDALGEHVDIDLGISLGATVVAWNDGWFDDDDDEDRVVIIDGQPSGV